jgi:hypothetical protein
MTANPPQSASSHPGLNPGWTGWYRPHKGATWHAVCSGESQGEVWDLLGVVVHNAGDTIALPSHRHPDGPRVRET